MNTAHLFEAVLSIALQIIACIFIFKRKESFKDYDWLTFVSVFLASNVLASAISELGLAGPPWLWYLISSLLTIYLIVALIRAKATERTVEKIGDERTNLIYSKSSRNALFITYLIFFIHLLITDSHAIDTTWLIIIIAGGLLSLIFSAFFYYYRSF